MQETLHAGNAAGRPGDTDARCQFKDQNGNVRVVEGAFTTLGRRRRVAST